KICETYIHFERDEQKGLPAMVAILLRFTLVDENSGQPIFRMEAAAGCADHEIPTDQMPAPIAIQAGELELLLDSPNLEAVFLSALDDVYTHIEQGAVPAVETIINLA